MIRPPQNSTLFPYTTLFRSRLRQGVVRLPAPQLRRGRGRIPRNCRKGSGRGADHARDVLPGADGDEARDRKSTRLNSSHTVISYAVFCLKKKTKKTKDYRTI